MKKESVFWGVLFILAGIFLIISKLGYFPDVNIFSLLLTVFLVVVIVKSLPRLNFSGILFPSAFICIIYDKQLGLTAITPWTVLIAALFGSIGLSMIFHKHIKWINHKHNHEDYKFEKIDIEDESHVGFKNLFGASIKYINTDKFEQADFNCSFGAMKVYFDNAIMSNENAIVRINASFSGIELYIPKTWNVDDKTNVFLGSVNEKNRNNQITTNNLTLVGDVSFSGVEIIYI
ncbi:LiaF transmembrane domain-containing protein [Clostridium uliginosum]|uniref:Predicted membrane protein n=1 Tax=Clostridium uliginosum TaxID=119641 RepID=A0A1I1MRN4_9CLOT|nr:LiaF domain-containing protein [Clostridium uliginosum]SFC88041.1 Predicted membrane protein [Clostridium uliginosum]